MYLMLFFLCLHPSCTVNLVYHPDLQWPLRTRLAEYPACVRETDITTNNYVQSCISLLRGSGRRIREVIDRMKIQLKLGAKAGNSAEHWHENNLENPK